MAHNKETDRQLEAYNFYYELGDTRSLQKVASHFNVSYNTIRNWYLKYKWDDRVEVMDKNNFREIIAFDKKQMLNEMVQYRKIIKASVTKYLEQLKEGKIEIKSVRDLSVLIRLDLDLLVYIDNNKDNRTETNNYVEFFFSEKE